MFSRRVALAFFALSFATWLGITGAGCTDGTTPDCSSPESGCGPGFDGPPPESALSDAGSDQASDAAMDATADVTPDVTPDATGDVASEATTPDAPTDAPADVPSTSDGGTPCREHVGAGKTLECNYALSATSCPAGFMPGHCGAKNLAGCCVTGPTAVCFYNSDVPLPSVDETACTTAGHTWVTTPP